MARENVDVKINFIIGKGLELIFMINLYHRMEVENEFNLVWEC